EFAHLHMYVSPNFRDFFKGGFMQKFFCLITREHNFTPFNKPFIITRKLLTPYFTNLYGIIYMFLGTSTGLFVHTDSKKYNLAINDVWHTNIVLITTLQDNQFLLCEFLGFEELYRSKMFVIYDLSDTIHNIKR
ncbi:hypothetical protein ACJX0J_040441, partial [Zea mays]